MRRTSATLAAIALVAAVSCSDDAEPEVIVEPDEPESTTTTVSLEAEGDGSDPEDADVSDGVIEVAGERFELRFACLAEQPGEVLAVGIGESDAGERVEAYVQAFAQEPYIGLLVGDRLLEAGLEQSLTVQVLDDTVTASDVAFVEDLDLDTGEGDAAGTGSVEVVCASFGGELPASVFS